MSKVYYNVWSIVEKVTVDGNGEETYEDDSHISDVKVGRSDTKDGAMDIQNELSKEFESTRTE